MVTTPTGQNNLFQPTKLINATYSMVMCTETETVTVTETEMQEFTKSETQFTNVTSNESLVVTDTANMSKQKEKEAKFRNRSSEQENEALQPNVPKYDCSLEEKSPKDKPFHCNITVRPTSPNLTVTVINHEEKEEEQRLKMGKKGTHEVNSVLHGPIDKRCAEREFFKPLLEQLPQIGEIWWAYMCHYCTRFIDYKSTIMKLTVWIRSWTLGITHVVVPLC